jgi:flagellar biosynthesis/type III secretory pathway protein FliH
VTTTPRARIIDGQVYDAGLEARRIIAEARAEAERIRQRARDEGLAQAQAEVAPLMLRARREAQRLLDRAHHDIVALAVRIAERLVRRSLALDPEIVADIAEAAIAAAGPREELVVRLHPDDLAALEARDCNGSALLRARCHLRVQPDAGVGRGGCIVDSPAGSVDARLATQLAAIERALLEGP